MATTERQPHAALDLVSRHVKGRKIQKVLGLMPGHSQPLRVLEIGTGSGGIAHFFATAAGLDATVVAVDVNDQRQVTEGYEFMRVDDTSLPFLPSSFDVVISNHVIEHVGDRAAQQHHLAEMLRVLVPGGMAYLAAPNRWMLVEPHYHLALLSWWPRSWRNSWLKLWRKGDVYDCEPLQLNEIETLLAATGWRWQRQGVVALGAFVELEGRRGLAGWVASVLPVRLIRRLEYWMPTLVFTLWKPDCER